MKRIFTLTFSIIAFAAITSTSITFAQQQIPARTPFTKEKNRLVTAVPLSGFSITPATPAQLVSYLLGPGAIISNLSYTGSPLALGIFVDSASSFGIDTGIVISTGNIMDVPGPNVSSSTSSSLGSPGDSMLSIIAGSSTLDAAVIEFDLTVLTDTLGADFVFASEEYNEFANSNFNDLFAFFVSGPGIMGFENIAYIPGTSTVISINTINNGTMNAGPCINCQYYHNNFPGQPIEYDGFTSLFSLGYPILYGQQYHFKIALADCSDGVYDSGIFLKKGSVLGKACLPSPNFSSTVSGLAATFTNTTNYARFYTWNFGDGAVDTTLQLTNSHIYLQAGLYPVTLQSHNYYQTSSITQTINVGGVGIPLVNNASQEIKLQNLKGGFYKLTFRKNVNAEIRVYTLTGELIHSLQVNGSEAGIDLSNLAKGMYILQVNTQLAIKTWKLIR
ncbi:MAG: choice-of-anchor L domain-containing protein [Bacteroidetes bacterium]|nr:choice-of-anchor L domain-containing protein [Bacteroidota bacterium]